MKIKLLFFSILILLVSSSFLSEATVYICDSSTSKKFHYKPNCRGLNACKHEIKTMPQAEAEQSGRVVCGWEDKKNNPRLSKILGY